MTLDEAKTEIGKLATNCEDAARLLADTDVSTPDIDRIITGLETAARNARKIMEGS